MDRQGMLEQAANILQPNDCSNRQQACSCDLQSRLRGHIDGPRAKRSAGGHRDIWEVIMSVFLWSKIERWCILGDYYMRITEYAQTCQRTKSITTMSFNVGLGGNPPLEGLACRFQSVLVRGVKERWLTSSNPFGKICEQSVTLT